MKKEKDIKNRKFKDKGFSLIEILVAVLVFSMIAVVTGQSLSSSLRSSKKSESIGKVRENIEYVMNFMERKLRSAKSLDCINSNVNNLIYQAVSGQSAYFLCDNTSKSIIYNSGLNDHVINSSDVEIVCGNVFRNISCPGQGEPDSVDIEITGGDKYTLGSESYSYTARTKILLRNY